MNNPTINRPADQKPWYRYPWPWVAIAIPGAAVIMGITTLVLAISNPDPVIVDDQTYKELSSGLRAQQTQQEPAGQEQAAPPDKGDGVH